MNFKKPTVHKFGEHNVRSFHIDGKDRIVTCDIIDALEYRKTSRYTIGSKMRAKVDPAEIDECIVPTNYGSRAPYIVTAAGARQMIAGSRQPLMPAFRAWLDETFPSDPAAPLDEVTA